MSSSPSLLEMLAAVASFVFGFWVFFPLSALQNALSGRRKFTAQLRKIPRNLLIFWSFFAVCRLVTFVHPMPPFIQFVPEPLGTPAFFAAGSLTFALWWVVERGERALVARLAVRAPAASIARPATVSVKRQLDVDSCCLTAESYHSGLVASGKILLLGFGLQGTRHLHFDGALLLQPLIVKNQDGPRPPCAYAALHGA